MNTKQQIPRWIKKQKDNILFVGVFGVLGVLFLWFGCLVHGEDPSVLRLFGAAFLYILGSTLLMVLVSAFVLWISDKYGT